MARFSIPTGAIRGDAFRRSLTLFGSVLAALAGGTNYVFSAYAPQLGSRLHIDHTQLNMIGLAGNVGVYSTGPLWGSITDSRGPTMLYLFATIGLFVGYSGIKLFFDGVFKLPEETKHSSNSFAFLSLIVFAYLSGAGGNAGLMGSINAVARSFSDARRSTAVGLVASGFGLSAFFFSTLAHTAFSDSTSSFLSVLALGTTIPMILAFFIVKIIPPEDELLVSASKDGRYEVLQTDEDEDDGERDHERQDLPHGERLQRRLSELSDERAQNALSDSFHSYHDDNHHHHERVQSLDRRRPSRSRPGLRPSLERYRSRSPASSIDLSPEFSNIAATSSELLPHLHDLEDISEDTASDDPSRPVTPPAGQQQQTWREDPETILELVRRGDFWLMFFTVSLMAGTGLMWINNVGSIAQALVAQGQPDTWDQARAVKVQAAQVSIVSVTNSLGRVVIGIITDHAKHHHGIRRVFFLIPIAFLFITSQSLALHTTSPSLLFLSSATLGTAYGAMFSLAPMVTLEWFGIERFSRNWGTVALSPVLGGNLFSLAFGRNLDRHASGPSDVDGNGLPLPDTTEHMCFDGVACYEASLKMTIAACVGALILSTWAWWRDREIYAVRDRVRAAHARRGLKRKVSDRVGDEEGSEDEAGAALIH